MDGARSRFAGRASLSVATPSECRLRSAAVSRRRRRANRARRSGRPVRVAEARPIDGHIDRYAPVAAAIARRHPLTTGRRPSRVPARGSDAPLPGRRPSRPRPRLGHATRIGHARSHRPPEPDAAHSPDVHRSRRPPRPPPPPGARSPTLSSRCARPPPPPASRSTSPAPKEPASPRAELVRQLDDYVLPRLRRLDAPLLTVVGGSTGAGKSTRRQQPGPRRRSPRPGCCARPPARPCSSATPTICAGSPTPGCCPSSPAPAAPARDHRTLQLVTLAALDPGLAFLDAPDIDSVVTANRRLAAQLLAAADLWLFVTTAARYADAVPWDVLQTAQERGTALAMLLDRVPPGAEDDIARAPQEMLAAHGLAGARCSSCPRRPCVDGLLPDARRRPAARLVLDLARDAAARAPRSSARRWTARWTACARAPPASPRRPARRSTPRPRLRDRRRRRLRGRGRRRRRGHARRLAAARRGAGPLAGVRRHRRAAAHAAGPGRPAAGPAHRGVTGRRPAGHGADRRAGVRRRRCSSTPPPTGRRTGRDVVAGQRRRDRRCCAIRAGGRCRAGPRRRRTCATPSSAPVRDWQGAVLDLVRREGGGPPDAAPGSRPTG